MKTIKRKQENDIKKSLCLISTHGYVAAQPPLGAPDTGGQVVYVLELAKKLGEFGYQVDIFTRQFEDQPSEEEVSKNVALYRFPCGGKDFIPKETLVEFIPEWCEKTLKFIKKNKKEYEFINSHYWDAGVAGQLLSDQLETLHVHTPHSIGAWKEEQMKEDFEGTPDEMEAKYNFKQRIGQEKSIFRSCDVLVATTPIQAEKFQQFYRVDESKVVTIFPGYDDTRFFAVSNSSLEVLRQEMRIEGPVIYAVSRLAMNKGLDLLIEAFAFVAERIPDARLLLAIGHDERDEKEEAIYNELLELVKKLNLKDRVQFFGYIEDEEMPDFYRAADVFVLSSRYEPFGMTAIEAMACGTPAVVTTHGGLARVGNFGSNLMVADPFDAEEMGIAIYQILKYSNLRKRLSERGAQFSRSRFTWTGIAQQLLNAVDNSDL